MKRRSTERHNRASAPARARGGLDARNAGRDLSRLPKSVLVADQTWLIEQLNLAACRLFGDDPADQRTAEEHRALHAALHRPALS